MWTFDRDSPLPLYKQLVRIVEDAALSGRLAPGEKLPPERTLARLLNVNRSTVIQALDELAERDVILRKRGSGTFINPEKWGVLHYAHPLWRRPRPVERRDDALYEREAHALRQRAHAGDLPLFDLSRDDLAPDLLPTLPMPTRPWDAVIREEQDDGTARLGVPSFREAVRRFLRESSGLCVAPEEILITSGLRQAVFLITQCLLKPGDAVGVEAPSYFYSLPVFQAAGLRLYALPVDERGITPEGLESLLDRRPIKMIFLNPAFQNPTGAVMDEARTREILTLCARAHVPVMEDDAYSLLSFSGARHVPLKSRDANRQVIYAGSLSSYAGSGIRAGWIVAPEHVVNTLADARLMMDAGLSVLPQILAAEYLETALTGHIPALRRALETRALNLAAFLTDRFGDALTFSFPQGGLYLYAASREGDATPQETLRTFFRHGIIPAPGYRFGDVRAAFRLNHSMFQ